MVSVIRNNFFKFSLKYTSRFAELSDEGMSESLKNVRTTTWGITDRPIPPCNSRSSRRNPINLRVSLGFDGELKYAAPPDDAMLTRLPETYFPVKLHRARNERGGRARIGAGGYFF